MVEAKLARARRDEKGYGNGGGGGGGVIRETKSRLVLAVEVVALVRTRKLKVEEEPGDDIIKIIFKRERKQA